MLTAIGARDLSLAAKSNQINVVLDHITNEAKLGKFLVDITYAELNEDTKKCLLDLGYKIDPPLRLSTHTQTTIRW